MQTKNCTEKNSPGTQRINERPLKSPPDAVPCWDRKWGGKFENKATEMKIQRWQGIKSCFTRPPKLLKGIPYCVCVCVCVRMYVYVCVTVWGCKYVCMKIHACVLCVNLFMQCVCVCVWGCKYVCCVSGVHKYVCVWGCVFVFYVFVCVVGMLTYIFSLHYVWLHELLNYSIFHSCEFAC